MADARQVDTGVSKADWQHLVLACQIGAADTAVALALSIHAEGAELIASPGVRQLAHELKLSEQTVRRSLGTLRDLHLINRVEFGSTAKIRAQADRYKLAIPSNLEERVEVRPEPASAPAGRGRGGMANHIRWHERRSRLVATCIHCVESIAPEAIADQQDGPPPIETAPRVPTQAEMTATALYRYWDEDDNLLYIGVTANLHWRENSHIQSSSWMQFVARSTVQRFETRIQALDAEREAIITECPLFNSKHNDSPAAVRRLVEYLVEHDRTDLLAPAVSRG